MAAANDAILDSCTNNSDFAVICSFFEQFGDKTGLLFPSFQDLQQMIENDDEVPYPLIELHVKLMRKLKKTVSFDRWEKAAVKFAHSYSDKDGWDIERFGYKNTSTEVKLRLLKNLLEAQFDGNVKFKNEINQVSCDELRMHPLGRDIQGRRYWHLLDDDCNLRIYREDVDEETWELVSSDKESLVKLIEHLAAKKEPFSSEETTPEISEENSPNPSEEVKPEAEIREEDPEHTDRVAGETGDGGSKATEPAIKTSETKELECEVSEPKRFKPGPTEALTEDSAKCASEEPILSDAIEGPVLFVKGEGNGADCETGNPGRETEQETDSTEADDSETGKPSDNKASEERLKPETEVSEPLETEMATFPTASTENSSYQPEDVNPVRDKWKEPPPLDEKGDNPSVTGAIVVSQDDESANEQSSNPLEPNTCITASLESPICEKSASSPEKTSEVEQESFSQNENNASTTNSAPAEVTSSAIPEVPPVASPGPVETNLESSQPEQCSEPVESGQISNETQSSELSCPANVNTKEDGAETVDSFLSVDPEIQAPGPVTDQNHETIPNVKAEEKMTRGNDVPSSESQPASESSSSLPESDNADKVTEPEISATLKADEGRSFNTLPQEVSEQSQEEPSLQSSVSDSSASSVQKETQPEEVAALELSNPGAPSASQETVPTVPVVDELEENLQKSQAADGSHVCTSTDDNKNETVGESHSSVAITQSTAEESHSALVITQSESSIKSEVSFQDVTDMQPEIAAPVHAVKTLENNSVGVEVEATATKESSTDPEVQQPEEATKMPETETPALPSYSSIEISDENVKRCDVQQSEPTDCDSKPTEIDASPLRSPSSIKVDDGRVESCVSQESEPLDCESKPTEIPEMDAPALQSSSSIKVDDGNVESCSIQESEPVGCKSILTQIPEIDAPALPNPSSIEIKDDNVRSCAIQESEPLSCESKSIEMHEMDTPVRRSSSSTEINVDNVKHFTSQEGEPVDCEGQPTKMPEMDAPALRSLSSNEINDDIVKNCLVQESKPEGCESKPEDATLDSNHDEKPETERQIEDMKDTPEPVPENSSDKTNQPTKTEVDESVQPSEPLEDPQSAQISSANDDSQIEQLNNVAEIETHQPTCESSLPEKTEENKDENRAKSPEVVNENKQENLECKDTPSSPTVSSENSEENLESKSVVQSFEDLTKNKEENLEHANVVQSSEDPSESEKEIAENENIVQSLGNSPEIKQENFGYGRTRTENLERANVVQSFEDPSESKKEIVGNENVVQSSEDPSESKKEIVGNENVVQSLGDPPEIKQENFGNGNIVQSAEDPAESKREQLESENVVQSSEDPAEIVENDLNDEKLAQSTETPEVQDNTPESVEESSTKVAEQPETPATKLDGLDTTQGLSAEGIPSLAVKADEGLAKEEIEVKENTQTAAEISTEQSAPCSNPLSDKPASESVEPSNARVDVAETVAEPEGIEITESEFSKPLEPVIENELVEAPNSAAAALPNANAKVNETANDKLDEMKTVESNKEVTHGESANLHRETLPSDESKNTTSSDAEQVDGIVPTEAVQVEAPAHSEVTVKEAPSTELTSNSEQSQALPDDSNVTPIKAEKEKSATSTQLTFDFDASAPVPVVLPPIFKPPPAEDASPAAKRRGRKRGRTCEDGADDSAPAPVLRQSSRIAKLREKEDEERRKQEAERLQRLKEEHERREKRRAAREERMKKQEEKHQRRQQKSTKVDVVYEESEDDSDSSDEEEETSRKKGKKGRRKRGKKKKDRPWDSSESSESSSESDDDPLAELEQAEADNEELIFKSDHEFSPESDLDDDEEDGAKQPIKHARTARPSTSGKKKGRSRKIKEEELVESSEGEEESEDEELDASCQKCGQSDHPEWILLCDRCDLGWHASCLKPPLMVIPEGNWFCPPCDHVVLLERLQERLEAYEFLLKEKEAEIERKREQEREARLAEEAAKRAMEEQERQEEQEGNSDENELSADDANSGAGDVGADDVDDEETEEESGDEESDEERSNDSDADSDENLNKRRQRRAAKQANYSFKDFDDMIKSAIQDEGEEDPANPLGKGPRNLDDDEEEEEEGDGHRSPRSMRPSGKGEKRISTSDDDSDIMPKVIRKKKPRKLNDLSATEDEDDSDDEFKATSEDFSDSEEDDEEASESGSSFVVDDESDDDDDVVHVKGGRRGRAPSPVARRATRNARKKYAKMDSDSDSSEEESEYEVASKRKRGNDSWGESSEDSSSDASWGRSKKRRKSGGRAKPPPKPKAKPAPRKAPAIRGRGRGGGRASRADSDDEPFRTKAKVKKTTKAARPVVEDDEGSDPGQRRTTRGKQTSYKELISSGESNDEGSKPKGAAKFPAASRRGRGPASGVPTTSTRAPVAAEKAQVDGSLDAELAKAAAAFAEGADNPVADEILPPNVEPDLALASLPTVLPQGDVRVKENVAVPIAGMAVLPPDLQVSRLIQQRPSDTGAALPADLHINRLISSQAASSAGSSPARHSPMPQPRLLRDAPDSQTPPPPVQIPTTNVEQQLPAFGHGGVIKQARNQLPPTPAAYQQAPAKAADGPASTLPSVIRPYPTPVAPTASLSPSVPSGNSPGNPLSIQGLLSSPHGVPASSQASAAAAAPPIRPYANTSHMISHGPFLNHPPYGNPYAGVPSSRSGYMGTPVTPTPRPAYPPMYAPSHVPPPHALPPIHSAYPAHHGAPLRPSAGYQHAGFPQAFAAAAAAAANAEEERRIYRVTQVAREPDAFDVQPPGGPLLPKGGVDDVAPAGVPAESEFGGLVSYFSSQHEDFGEA